MHGYQSHPTVLQGGHWLGALIPCPTHGQVQDLSLREGKGQVQDLSLRLPFRQQLVVPVSPGHVRPLHPYPPSRRRRR